MPTFEAEDAPAGAEPEEQEDERPAEANEEAVAAGHVGNGVGGKRGVLAGLPGEGHVDGVLGKHRDQGDEGDGERLGDFDFGGLGGPGEEEGGGDDGEAVDGGVRDGADVGAGEAEPEGGEDERRGEEDDGRRTGQTLAHCGCAAVMLVTPGPDATPSNGRGAMMRDGARGAEVRG